HVFSYSERPGTNAAKLENKVPTEIIKSRSKSLHKLSTEKKLEFYRNNIMQESKVLFESKLEDGYIYGFTENYIRVKTPFKQELINNIISVKLDNLDEENVIFKIT
ncbi:MAG: tRNA (N(6)-L-threonylcarbamoyladenosine(37)-C(2))-methylthiotransferase MtaB, partial [Bacteroidales bacterium]|nr:tRNA (N(6)-L-threonylcarbamoyladenosine(37)-C(2))-methylthiotransferase MtaB [Bacteroidales bacterium]